MMAGKTLKSILNDKFGSKQGLVKYCYFCFLMHLGRYRPVDLITNSKTTRLVFICAGNICRSPLAEAVAGCKGFPSFSFGLETRGGDAADARAIAFARQQGIDISVHVTRRVSDYIPMHGDLIVAMEPNHLKQYKKLNLGVPSTLLGIYGKKPMPYIHDPFVSSEQYFHCCEARVLEYTEKLINYVS
ncbi:hypothetical protein [Reinekea sp.]|jgi:protein-tyrosine phosphatase|uniref:arsenate-mycothiol transferase ArsC n=1 Tax=Reinekea sp. TaxID=1970455 RepID=UPI002A815EEA|nr:hypothetical protein [Reinekea sp.]